jgi:hypothetical protein
MGEEVPLEGAERVDDGLARLRALVALECAGGGFDGAEVAGDAAVLGLEPVDNGIDGGVGAAQL